jgi:ankyrin repeat protein
MAATSDRSEVAKLLLDEGADPNATTAFGATALHAAVENESKRTLEILMAEGADVNAKDKQDRTPLDVAVGEGLDELAELLRRNRSK